MSVAKFEDIFLVVLVILFSISTLVHCEPIIKGKPVTKLKYPFVVNLEIFYWEDDKLTGLSSKWRKQCGGSIISRKTILTAGHCLEDCITDPEVFVYAGVLKRKNFGHSGQVGKMKHYEIHPDYVKNDIDLALLYLEKPLLIVPKFAEIASFTTTTVEAIVTISGWGFTENHIPSDVLRSAEVRKVPCKNSYHGDDNFFCVLDLKRVSMFADGDSGGPIIFNGKIAGVIIECDSKVAINRKGDVVTLCKQDAPGTAVNVNKHLKWITNNIH